MTTETSIYVASLSDYNAGHLYGCWIELAGNTPEGVQEEIDAMLENSKNPCGEEWAIHYHGSAVLRSFGENPDLDAMCAFCEAWEENGNAWEAYAECVGVDYATVEGFQEDYAGEADSALEWVRDYVDSTGMLNEVPENLRAYFDYEAFLRDLQAGGEISFADVAGTTYAFFNR